MKTVTYNSLRSISQAAPGDGIGPFANDTIDRLAGPPRGQTRVSITLIGCLVMSLLPLSTVVGQTEPNAISSRRAEKTPNARTTAPTEALAAEHSSPNAEHAIDSLLSRTAAPSNGDNTDANVSDILARRLWQNRMSAPDPDEDADTRLALQNLISRVQSMRFSGSDTEPTYSAPAPPTTNAAPTATPPIGNTAREIAAPLPNVTAPTSEPAPTLEPATLERLESLLQDPNQVEAPLDMAELLFLSGRPAKAAVFYEKALARLTPGDRRQDEDRAWILFQLGNCLRETDMAKAKATYMKLIAQYPGSPWTELAKAHGRLITWYQGTKPDQWMPAKETP